MLAEAFVEEVDHSAHPRSVANAFMSEEPKHPLMVAARWKAAYEVGIGVGNNAGQDGDAEARADPRKQST